MTNCYSTHTDDKIRDLPRRCIKQDSSTAFLFSFTLPSKMKECVTNYYISFLMVFLLAGTISWVNFAGQPNLNSAFLRDKWIRKFFSYSGTFILFFKKDLDGKVMWNSYLKIILCRRFLAGPNDWFEQLVAENLLLSPTACSSSPGDSLTTAGAAECLEVTLQQETAPLVQAKGELGKRVLFSFHCLAALQSL